MEINADTLSFDGHFKIAGKLGGKTKGAGKKRPLYEFVRGDDYWRKKEKWMWLERIFDRVKNLYTERVVDPQTGEVVWCCQEQLTEHRRSVKLSRKL